MTAAHSQAGITNVAKNELPSLFSEFQLSIWLMDLQPLNEMNGDSFYYVEVFIKVGLGYWVTLQSMQVGTYVSGETKT